MQELLNYLNNPIYGIYWLVIFILIGVVSIIWDNWSNFKKVDKS